jgi:DNA (cytosine-5)-methyltransferase 1
VETSSATPIVALCDKIPWHVSKPPVIWSFFSGAMGLDLGLEAEGLKPSLAIELEPVFCETICRNRTDVRVVRADVARLTGFRLREITGQKDVDLMVGGPPCQSFCPGGKRAALSDPRGNLIFEYLRLVAEVRPRRFVLENVANLLTAAVRHRPIAERPGKSWNLASYSKRTLVATDEAPPLELDEQSGSAVRLLLETAVSELGYGVSFGVINAAKVGAPQRRYRFVMLGDRDGHPPPLPPQTHGDGLEPTRTVRDAIGDLVDGPGPGSHYTPEVRDVFDLVPEGGNWRSLSPAVARAALGEKSYKAGGGKTGFFRRLAWDAPAPTITGRANRKGSALCHPSDSRPLSVRECARIQGFPDAWELCGSINKMYLQVGNAVPVALGAAIGRSLLADGMPTVDHETMLADAIRTLRASARNRQAALATA